MAMLSIAEVQERLGALDLARPVFRRHDVEKHILKFIEKLEITTQTGTPKKIPPVVWIDGVHDIRNRMLDRGIYPDELARTERKIGDFVSSCWSEFPTQPNIHRILNNTLVRPGSPPPLYHDHRLFRDNDYLQAFEAGLGYWSLRTNALVLISRPILKTRLENDPAPTNQQPPLIPVLHSTIGPAVQFAHDKASDQYWLRGTRVPDFVITDPTRITRAHIRAASQNRGLRDALIEQYGLLRYAQETGFRFYDRDNRFGATLWVKGGRPTRQFRGDLSERQCIVELVNSTPEPNGEYRHFARRVPREVANAHQAVAWTFGFWPNYYDYNPTVQT